MTDRKLHWENVYNTKAPQQMSWTQDVPQTSLDFINSFDLPETASIIDIGGGDSKLVDHLLDQGYRNITVLDISAAALEKAKKRLGNKASGVKWLVSDIAEFKPAERYDLWHDRATFHFLTTPGEIGSYLQTAQQAVKGYLAIDTFSENGPKKCSGLEIKQYSEDQLSQQLSGGFQKLHCIALLKIILHHLTPSKTFYSAALSEAIDL